MTSLEQLEFIGEMYGVRRSEARRRAAAQPGHGPGPGGASTSYTALLVNEDGSLGVAEAMGNIQYKDGAPLLKVRNVTDRAAAERMLKDRQGDALVIVPEGFEAALAGGPESRYILTGDLTNPRYTVAAILAATAIEGLIQQQVSVRLPVQFAEEPLGASGARTEFESYVPGLLMIAVEMLMFKFAMMLAAEVETGTLRRLRHHHRGFGRGHLHQPPTHAVTALNKVLTMDQGLADIRFELLAISLLSTLYFAGGVWLSRSPCPASTCWRSGQPLATPGRSTVLLTRTPATGAAVTAIASGRRGTVNF